MFDPEEFDDALRNEALSSWIAEHEDLPFPGIPNPISTSGSDPIPADGLDSILTLLGYRVERIHPECDIIVVGRADVNYEAIYALIRNRPHWPPRIYSQEMFIAYCRTGRDPFDNDIHRLLEFAEGHPTLESLSRKWDKWVTTNITLRSGPALEVAMPSIGVLRAMGYQVGRTSSLSTAQRRAKLSRAFEGPLGTVRVENVYEWGAPSTPERLHKLANCLASFARNAKRRTQPDNDMAAAISDWESDLDWLYEAYYKNRFRFAWPYTD